MPAVTIAPSDEALAALTAWINVAAQAYTLPTPAASSYLTIDDLSDVTALQVDITHKTELNLNNSLDAECPTEQSVIVWVRNKLANRSEIPAANLIFRQIYQRVNAMRTPGRVAVKRCGYDDVENPDKDLLDSQLLYKAGIEVILEVAAPE